MKIRNLVFGFVLSVMVLCAGNFTVNTVKASPCTDNCRSIYLDCKAWCSGDPYCLGTCENDYNCCMIHICQVGPGQCL